MITVTETIHGDFHLATSANGRKVSEVKSEMRELFLQCDCVIGKNIGDKSDIQWVLRVDDSELFRRQLNYMMSKNLIRYIQESVQEAKIEIREPEPIREPVREPEPECRTAPKAVIDEVLLNVLNKDEMARKHIRELQELNHDLYAKQVIHANTIWVVTNFDPKEVTIQNGMYVKQIPAELARRNLVKEKV